MRARQAAATVMRANAEALAGAQSVSANVACDGRVPGFLCQPAFARLLSPASSRR